MSGTRLFFRLNCPVEPFSLKSWGRLFPKRATPQLRLSWKTSCGLSKANLPLGFSNYILSGERWIVNNYSPKRRWKVVHIKYLPLFTDTEVKNYFSMHVPNHWIASTKQSFFFWEMRENSGEIQNNTGRWIADTILCLSSQSERAKNTIHWFGICYLL